MGDEKERNESYYDKQPDFSKKGPSKLRQQFNRGMTYFLVVAASIVFYFAFLRFTNLSNVFGQIVEVLKPVLYGLAIAYLLNPIVRNIDRLLVPRLEKKLKRKNAAKKLSRSIGIFTAIVVLVMIVVALCNMLIPELYKSIRDMIITLPSQLQGLSDEAGHFIKGNSTLGKLATSALDQGMDYLQEWMRTDLLRQTNTLMSSLTVGVLSVVSEFLNLIIGIIISVYVLFSKELFAAQCKKIVYAIFNTDHANLTLHLAKKSNDIFGGFIIGKIIDSAIIGVLCFFGLSILDMPYTLLVSVIVGVTNVIPFFGPYIGAIPSAILIMLQEPVQGIYFAIFILILQQIDGNIIGPKILGDSTGLSAFWVIFAILLGGGLFGFAGMIMGVPTFAVIYYIVQMMINQKLKHKKLPTESDKYRDNSYVELSGRFVEATVPDNRQEQDGQKGE